MPYRVAVVLQESTDVPGRWRTIDTRLVGAQQTRQGDAEMSRVVAVVAAQGAVDMLDEGQATWPAGVAPAWAAQA